MTCHNCKIECRKFGKTRKGQQRYRCCECYKTYSEPRNEHLGGMYTSPEKVEGVLNLLVEGCSIRSTQRLTGIDQNTIMKILVLVGERCQRFLERTLHALPVRDVQCDEIWGFVGCKERNNDAGDPRLGDAYCYVAIEKNTKLVITWHLGKRAPGDTWVFIRKLEAATTGEFQATTDGWASYPEPILAYLRDRVSYSQLIKVYGPTAEQEHRYSPPQVIDTIAKDVCGDPDPERICTSHVERQNLSIRMGMRRLTRLTNAFSKKWQNLNAAYALWFAYYNFCRIHQTLRVTPAMEAGLSTHVWSLEELLQAA